MTTGSAASRYQAPIAYIDIRGSYNTFRAVGGVLIALLALAAWSRGVNAAPAIAIAGGVVFVDGVVRRTNSVSALPLLFVDTTVIGLTLVLRGHTAVLEGPAFLYVLTAAMLLLPLRTALWMQVYVIAWALPIGWLSPLIEQDQGVGTALFEFGAVAVFVTLIAELLYSAGRALYEAGERHREALASERRAVRLKDEFVSMVSHELRTPLTSIAGFTDTLRETWARLDPTEVEEFLQIMRRETGHLADLVEDILVIPRLDAGQLRLEPERLDLREHSYQTAEVVFQDGDTDFGVAIPGGVMVAADPVRLKQILRNLLENARKYGGDQVIVEGETEGEFYKVMVVDNGPGVPEDDRSRIFEHFEQVSKGDARIQQGVGLGLPIARKLARAMGGDLWFEPRFPIGSLFCFTVRLADADASGDPEDTAEPAKTA